MSEQPETTSREISNYEEYLSTFLPDLKPSETNIVLSPEETGIKMAEETLLQIQNLLLENKVD